MRNWAAFWALPLIAFLHGCSCQMPCCRYLMAPSTIYVQMNPNAYGQPPADHHSTAATTTTEQSQVIANHLQWVIMTDKPWTQANNVYYAVNALPTPAQSAPPVALDPNQPTLLFMPNWWNKIQQVSGVNNPPFSIQLQSPMLPSANPAFQMTHHSYPPLNVAAESAADAESKEAPQPAATITVLNEQNDLLTQDAKSAQHLLMEIQQQLQRLNTLATPLEAPAASAQAAANVTVPTELPPSTPAASPSSTPNSSEAFTPAASAPTPAPTNSQAAVSASSERAANDTQPTAAPKTEFDDDDDDDKDEALEKAPPKPIPQSAAEDEEVGGRRPAAKLSREHKYETQSTRSHNSASGLKAALLTSISFILPLLALYFL